MNLGPSMLNTAADMKQTNSNAMPVRSDSSKGYSKLSFGSDANDLKRVGQTSQVSFGDALNRISEAADTIEESKKKEGLDESVNLSALSEESGEQEKLFANLGLGNKRSQIQSDEGDKVTLPGKIGEKKDADDVTRVKTQSFGKSAQRVPCINIAKLQTLGSDMKQQDWVQTGTGTKKVEEGKQISDSLSLISESNLSADPFSKKSDAATTEIKPTINLFGGDQKKPEEKKAAPLASPKPIISVSPGFGQKAPTE